MRIQNLFKFGFFVMACVAVLASPFSVSASTVTDDDKAPWMRAGKWIEIVLLEQQLNAWQDGSIVMSTPISSGTHQENTYAARHIQDLYKIRAHAHAPDQATTCRMCHTSCPLGRLRITRHVLAQQLWPPHEPRLCELADQFHAAWLFQWRQKGSDDVGLPLSDIKKGKHAHAHNAPHCTGCCFDGSDDGRVVRLV